MADLELQFIVNAQMDESLVVPHITSLEKDEYSNLKIQFLLNAYYFCAIVMQKIVS
jgi:hypothetical protein